MGCVIVHGGCGRVPREAEQTKNRGVEEAASVGLRVLREGGSALDAVEAAVRLMEDDPSFNAGTGSVLTLHGDVEMDASVMTSSLDCGAVAAVRGIAHPVTLARLVMEQTDHVLLTAQGANLFARVLGVPAHDPVTEERRRRWSEVRAQIEQGGADALSARELEHWTGLSTYLEQYLEAEERGMKGTVGAVARDDNGLIAAATSTGGIWFKLPGRVGDTPVIGAGTYAAPAGAASATGHGEGIIKLCLAQRATAYMETMSAQEAASRAIDLASHHGVECGLITVDATGDAGSAFNSGVMPIARRSTERP